jgi:hypothetical protein
VICQPCQQGAHDGCPEVARQRRGDLSATEKAGSHLCTCSHQDGMGKLIREHQRQVDLVRAWGPGFSLG